MKAFQTKIKVFYQHALLLRPSHKHLMQILSVVLEMILAGRQKDIMFLLCYHPIKSA